MLRGPFAYLTVLIALAILAWGMCLPLALLGYPGLALAGLWVAASESAGRDGRRAEMAAVWVAYFGMVLALTGVVWCVDSPLAGSSPSAEDRRTGSNTAYVGGATAVLSAVAGYALRLRRKAGERPAPAPAANHAEPDAPRGGDGP